MVHLVADKLTREAGESDAHWKERVRRFMAGGVFCKTCNADLVPKAEAAGVTLDPLACYCGPECDPNEETCEHCDSPAFGRTVDDVNLCRRHSPITELVAELEAHHKRLNDPHLPWGYWQALALSRSLETAIAVLRSEARIDIGTKKPKWLLNAEKRSSEESVALFTVSRVWKRLEQEAGRAARLSETQNDAWGQAADELARLAVMLRDQMPVLRRNLAPEG